MQHVDHVQCIECVHHCDGGEGAGWGLTAEYSEEVLETSDSEEPCTAGTETGGKGWGSVTSLGCIYSVLVTDSLYQLVSLPASLR